MGASCFAPSRQCGWLGGGRRSAGPEPRSTRDLCSSCVCKPVYGSSVTSTFQDVHQPLRKLSGLGRGVPMHEVGQREAAARQCVPLSEALVRRHAKLHTLFVTFTNEAASIFAANWAKQLAAIGLSGIVGVVDRLPLVHLEAISSAGSGLFCGSGQYMRRNGQAGRWAEVAPLLRFGVNVLISDADIAWFRDPRPYFREIRRVHPHVDFLLCTDRAFNGYHTAPLHRSRGAGAARESALATDLDLEDGVGSAIPSYNIGILMLYAHAASNISAMIDVLWVRAVQTVEYDKRTGKKQPMNNGLARWDQGPINSFVLRGRAHPLDNSLVLLDKALPHADDVYAALDRQGDGPRVRLGMGVLPMLQFTTAFTYFIQAALREHSGARPFSLHAIYSHGGGMERKIALLREAHVWHDPPSYYDDDQRGYLTYNASLPERALRHGGFEMIMSQLRRLELALRIAHLANRTLVFPPMRCGNMPMAYPCFAWYHRATTSGGFRHDRVPMPELCPSYYWFDEKQAEEIKLKYREHSFLTNPRTPRALSLGSATLHIAEPRAERVAGASVPARVDVSRLTHALRSLGHARVVHIPELHRLSVVDGRSSGGGLFAAFSRGASGSSPLSLPRHNTPLGSGLHEISRLFSGFWCTACVTTRRGGVLQEINRSSARELEKFCRVEARGALGYPGARQTCCGLVNGLGHPNGCPRCEVGSGSGQRTPWNASALSFHVSQWLPQWAELPEPRGDGHASSASSSTGHTASVAEQYTWRCLHPLCTGADPTKFP